MATYHSFAELAAARGIKVKRAKSEPARKCPKCGDTMRQLDGTNVYVCDHVDFADAKLGERPVMVFTKCKTVIFI